MRTKAPGCAQRLLGAVMCENRLHWMGQGRLGGCGLLVVWANDRVVSEIVIEGNEFEELG